MKHLALAFLATSLFFSATAAPEPPQPTKPPRTVSVSGSAVGYIQPDAILWTVFRESSGKNIIEAKEANEAQIKTLLDACSKKGIPGTDVSLGMISVQDTQTGQGADLPANAKRFVVGRTITIRQRELAIFHDMLDLLSKGTGKVKYTTYCSKTDKITRDTLLRATQAAKDKAAAMANVLGATLGPVLSLDEYPPVGSTIKNEDVVVDESTAIFNAEAEKLRVTVYAVFELL